VSVAAYRLRRATAADVDRLHALLAVPAVNAYLADGQVPPRDAVVGWIDKAEADFTRAGIGVWLLEDERETLAGCVRGSENVA